MWYFPQGEHACSDDYPGGPLQPVSQFSALVIREEIPSPFPVGCQTDGLPKLTRQHCVMLAPGYRLFLLIPATGGSALPDVTLRLGIPHQAFVETPLPEVHSPSDLRPDIPALRTFTVFVRTTWANTRGILEFQLLSITPRHYTTSMAVKQRPTSPEGVAYQPAD